MTDDRTTSEKLAAHGLGHRRPTAEDRAALGRGPMTQGHAIYVAETGELVCLATAWDMDQAITRIERAGRIGPVAEQVRRVVEVGHG